MHASNPMTSKQIKFEIVSKQIKFEIVLSAAERQSKVGECSSKVGSKLWPE